MKQECLHHSLETKAVQFLTGWCVINTFLLNPVYHIILF